MKHLVDKEFWEARHKLYTGELFKNYRYFADRILQRFLTYDTSLSFLEVGCVPGGNMVYFARNFGYQVSGLDYSDAIQHMGPVLRAHGIDQFELFQCDFFEFSPPSKYDIVFSAGFVEHFTEPELVFKKHCDLLRSGGFLIISLPNFQYGQKLLRILLGVRHEFDWHNLDVMFPHIWSTLAEKEGLSVLYCNYAATFRFWLTPDYNPHLNLLVHRACRVIEMGLRVFHLDQVPNRYFSPGILLVARKP